MDTPYQKYFDLMPCYVTVQDRELKLIAANSRFCESFGDIEGRYCYQVYKHRSEKCEVCPVERTFRDGLNHTNEEQVTCLDGTEVSVLVNATPIHDGDGQIVAVMEMSTDITEIKNLQKQMRDSRRRYRMLFESVPCHISIQDRDLRIIEANRMHREAFGPGLGRKCYEVYKHRAEACTPCVVRDSFHDGEVHLHEEVVTDQHGHRMNVMVYTGPLFDADGNIESVIEMSADITQIRQLQSQLTSIGMLISTISHGIKGLMTGLDGGAYLLNSGLKKGNQERITKGWDMVQRNMGRIRSMVFDLLYYAKDRELEVETVEAAVVAEEAARLFTDKAQALNIDLKCDFHPDAGTFDVDPKAIQTMLTNLLENAMDACRTDPEKPSHGVGFNAYREGRNVVFRISDNGIGMDRETKEKVFSLFFSSKGTEGTGLGLFIANKIAMKHGGKIDIESTPGDGTCFWVHIPAQQPGEGLIEPYTPQVHE